MSGEGLRGQGCFQMKHSSQAGGGAGAAQVGWRQQMEEAKPQDVQGTSTPAHHAGGRLRRVEFAQAMDSGTPPQNRALLGLCGPWDGARVTTACSPPPSFQSLCALASQSSWCLPSPIPQGLFPEHLLCAAWPGPTGSKHCLPWSQWSRGPLPSSHSEVTWGLAVPCPGTNLPFHPPSPPLFLLPLLLLPLSPSSSSSSSPSCSSLLLCLLPPSPPPASCLPHSSFSSNHFSTSSCL